jgi:acetyl-CoA carboxylase carboxyltransferase component
MALNVKSELQGTVVGLFVDSGDEVRAGTVVALIESMKMHHEVVAPQPGTVAAVLVRVGDAVASGQELVRVDPSDATDTAGNPAASSVEFGAADRADGIVAERADLTEVIDRHARTTDDQRPGAVAKRRDRGRRTARENLAHLVEIDTFVEYGPLVIAAQRRRRSIDDLVENTPADGLVGGVGEANRGVVDASSARTTKVVAVSYDYTVLAGTQGTQNHRKKDRLFEVAEQLRLPIVFFTEGGGGRPGDTDGLGVSGLDCLAFQWFGELSGTVPLIGVNAGYCFAGNAAILGCCDVVIATEDSNIGMGGPAMIEGGGLGVYDPKEIGPIGVQSSNGVVDIVVADEAEAVEVARRYLSYFQGTLPVWEAPDPEAARAAVPVDRLRAYDMHRAVDALFDVGSTLELRSGFGVGMITALARVEGRPVGVVANNPTHLAGAIDSDGADKAARFMQLCDAYGLPIVTLVDTPGMMVGPDVEATALVRHCSRLFVTGANISVPMVSIVTRKAYGLGAQAMMGGSTKAPLACLAWPTGEFGGMGLEGAVRLGYRKELEAANSPEERDSLFRAMVDRMYEHGKAVSMATHFEIDDVIDPADTRRWITTLLDAAPETHWNAPGASTIPRRPNIDTW